MTRVILLIHEHEVLRRFVAHVLELQGQYIVISAAGVDAAIQALQQQDPGLEPDILLIGREQTQSILASPLMKHVPSERRIPVLVMDDASEVYADPVFNRVAAEPRALLLKLTVLERPLAASEMIERDGLRLDVAQRQAFAGHLPLNLTPLAFGLLHFLMRYPGRVYSRTQLLESVWKDHGFVEERTVDVHVYRLRNQLARYGYGHLIEAVRGAGYRFCSVQKRRPDSRKEGILFAS